MSFAVVMAGCGGGERTVETIPLPTTVDQCLDELQATGQPMTLFGVPAEEVQLCAVLAGLDCVLIEPLCAGDEACASPTWSCSNPGLELEAGDAVDAHLFIVQGGDGSAACDSVSLADPPTCSDSACLARIDYEIEYADSDDEPLRVTSSPVRIFHSGFVSETVGTFDTAASSICSPITDFTCVGDGCDAPTRINLSLGGVGSGAVTIASVASEEECTGVGCTAFFPSGRATTLTASASAGSVFGDWGGACAGSGRSSTCSLTASGDTTVSARFAHRLDIRVRGQGAVRSSAAGVDGDGINCPSGPTGATCAEDYVTDRQVVLTAETEGPSPWPFSGWVGCDSVDGESCTVSTDRSREVVATFGREVAISVVGGGSVALTINGESSGQTCAASCAFTFEPGTQVSLQATANTGSTRYDWQGACSGVTDDVCDLGTVDTDQSLTVRFGYDVTASFDQALGAVTANVTGGEPSVACESGVQGCVAYLPGTEVTYAASALTTPPTAFTGWGPGLCASASNNPSCMLNVGVAGAVVAGFERTVELVAVLDNRGQAGGTVTRNPTPTAENCAVDCTDRYLVSTAAVQLTATAPLGTRFIEWQLRGGGAPCVGPATNMVCTVDISDGVDRIVDAVFVSTQRVVVDLLGEGTGTLTPDPNPASSGWSCSASQCSGDFDAGETITLLVQTPANNHLEEFRNGGPNCNGGTTCTFTVDDLDLRIEAEFEFERTLELLFAGGSAGSVVLPPSFDQASSLTCTANCSRVYLSGRTFTLDANPGNNVAFGGWQGCNLAAGTSCSVVMDADPKRLTATFLPPRELELELLGSGSGQVEAVGVGNPSICSSAALPFTCPTLSYPDDSSVTLTVQPNPGTDFTGWGGACAGVPGTVCTVQMDQNRSVTASFAQRVHDVTVNFGGAAASSGIVRWLNPARANCNGPASCTETVNEGTTVRLEPVVQAGVQFQQWNGCDSVSGGTVCELSNVTADRAVEAVFVPLEVVTVNLAGSGSGRIIWTTPSAPDCVRTVPGTCTESVEVGQPAQIRAEAADGDTLFVDWTGCDSTSGDQCNIDSVSASGETVTATFVALHDITITLGGDGNGSVEWTSPALGTCDPVTCAPQRVEQGTTVTLTAQTVTGSSFIGWTGCDAVSGTSNEICTLTSVSADRNPVATYFDDRTIAVSMAGTGSAGMEFYVDGALVASCPDSTLPYSCPATFPYTAGTVTLQTVIIDVGTDFVGWSDGCTGTGTCVVDITTAATHNRTATFN